MPPTPYTGRWREPWVYAKSASVLRGRSQPPVGYSTPRRRAQEYLLRSTGGMGHHTTPRRQLMFSPAVHSSAAHASSSSSKGKRRRVPLSSVVVAAALTVLRVTAKHHHKHHKLSKAERRGLGMRGMVIASSGVGHSVRTWWDEAFVRNLQQGEPGGKMPKHGGWNEKIVSYLDCPGFITSMRAGIGLQDVWIVKFRDGLEIPLHRSCFYKSLYPQLRALLKGTLPSAPAPPPGLGASIRALPPDLKLCVTQFLFHSAQPSPSEAVLHAFEAASKRHVRQHLAWCEHRKSVKVVTPEPVDKMQVEKKEFVKYLEWQNGVPKGQREALIHAVAGETGDKVSWEVVTKHNDVFMAKRRRRASIVKPATASPPRTGSMANLEHRPSTTGPPAKPAAKKTDTQPSPTAAKKPDAPPAPKTPAAVKQPPPEKAAAPAAATPVAVAVGDGEDVVVRRGPASLPVTALQNECARLAGRVAELEDRCADEAAARLNMVEMVNLLRLQRVPKGRAEGLATPPPPKARGAKVQLRVECLCAHLSRRTVPPFTVTSLCELDTLDMLHRALEGPTGIPQHRQVIAILDRAGRARRLQLPHGRTPATAVLSDIGMASGAQLLVGESSPVTADIRLGPSVRIRVKVHLDTQVSLLKDAVRERVGAAADRIELRACIDGDGAGMRLSPDEATLYDCGVRGGLVRIDATKKLSAETAVVKAPGRPPLEVPYAPSDPAGAVRSRVAQRLGVQHVVLDPPLPDGVAMKDILVTNFTACPDRRREAAARLADRVQQVREVVTRLADNTAGLQGAVRRVKELRSAPSVFPFHDPYVTPPGSPPTLALASAVDSAAHLLAAPAWPDIPLDIPRRTPAATK